MPLIKPHRPEAEQAVIKCLLKESELFYSTRELKPQAFFHNENSIVYGVLIRLIESEQTPDEVMLIDELKRLNHFDVVGEHEYFERLNSIDSVLSNYPEYVDQVYDAYLRREIISTGHRITDAAYNHESETSTDLLFNETERILKLANQGLIDATAIDELVLEEFEKFLERINNPGESGIPTSFESYDMLTGGFAESDEIIIAARPSAGKTSLALRFMLNLAANDYPCAFFSYEMSKSQLMQRLFAMQSKVNLAKVRTGRVSEEEYERVAKAANSIGKLPMYFVYDSTASVTEIVNEARRLIRKYNVKVIFVDYLQLIPHRMELATLELGNITRRLKNLAVSSGVVSVVLSQLNRQVENRQDKRPMLSDLRQSGSIEEHSDVVLMLYREEMYFPTEQNKGQAEVLIRKNRNGPIGMLPMEFEAKYVDFSGV